MNANAVIFAQPTRRVYHCLPPPREDIADCLAMLFVGPCKPTSKEFRRTPFIIRRHAVARALQWLILNHPDYEHVGILYDLLEQYPEDEPPVCVIYRYGVEECPPESQPSCGDRDNQGLVGDACTFSVQGLSEDAYISMSRNERIATAIKHFDEGGGALAYGHRSEPTSIFGDPQLYPRMFPWLYPYGLGGFDNGKIKSRVGLSDQVAVAGLPVIAILRSVNVWSY
ncbi:hypothetical protein C8Q73DRAFT_743563 [Cubamyces lactineus]|nr:hypothetical protein C8Q73DRAFT_743563 [Cubamyces lactineus]